MSIRMRKTVTESGTAPNIGPSTSAISPNSSGAISTSTSTNAAASATSSPLAWTPNTSSSARHASSHHHHQQHHASQQRQQHHQYNDQTANGLSASTPIGASVGGFTAMSNRAPPKPNPFKYQRDFMVGLYSPDLPLPEGCDLSDKILVSDQVLEPMANIPLTETEKKVRCQSFGTPNKHHPSLHQRN